MRVFQISVQKAVAVFKKDTNFDKNNPISVAMWPMIWKLLQKNKEILLTTGAKLCIEDMAISFTICSLMQRTSLMWRSF